MRIINLIQKPQFRGAELFACQLSNHLLQLGHEVIVVSIFSGQSKLPFNGEIIHLERPIEKRFFDLKGWKMFSQIVKEFKPDIIQANAADTLKFLISAKLLYGLADSKLVFRNANKMGDFINSKLKWHLNNFLVGKLDYVISVSKECEYDFSRTFNFNQHNIETIEIGVEDVSISKLPNDLEEKFNDSKVITHIGSFVTEKNHVGLVNIVQQLVIEFPDLIVLLIGKGNKEEEILELIKDKGLASNFHFLGYRTDVLEILKHSDAFVLPSLIEGLPGVILEAMFCETPVVAYNVGGVSEVVNSNTGFITEKNDESKFLEYTKEALIKDPSVLNKISKAKQMVHEKFLNGIIAKRFLNAYTELISASGK